MALRNDIDLSWLDGSPMFGGNVTEKNWAMVHGHPVNFGSDSGGGGGAKAEPHKNPPALSGTDYHKALNGVEGGAMSMARTAERHTKGNEAGHEDMMRNTLNHLGELHKQHTADAARFDRIGVPDQAAAHRTHADNLAKVQTHLHLVQPKVAGGYK